MDISRCLIVGNRLDLGEMDKPARNDENVRGRVGPNVVVHIEKVGVRDVEVDFVEKIKWHWEYGVETAQQRSLHASYQILQERKKLSLTSAVAADVYTIRR
jgi:hypothetical protein